MQRLFIIGTVTTLALLTACSGDDSPPPAQQDFTEQVRQLTATSSETADPVSVDTLTVDSSETDAARPVDLP